MAKTAGNYFTSMISRFGTTDIMSELDADTIQRDAKRVFREMIKGRIDLGKYGVYFQDPKFTDNLLVACETEYNYNYANSVALTFYDNTYPGDRQINYNKYVANVLCTCYGAILTRLQALKASMYTNIGVLTDIPIILRDYKDFVRL